MSKNTDLLNVKLFLSGHVDILFIETCLDNMPSRSLCGRWLPKKDRRMIELFYLNTIEQLFLFVEQLDQLEVCLPNSRLLTWIPKLAVFQNLRWNSNIITIVVHTSLYSNTQSIFIKISITGSQNNSSHSQLESEYVSERVLQRPNSFCSSLVSSSNLNFFLRLMVSYLKSNGHLD